MGFLGEMHKAPNTKKMMRRRMALTKSQPVSGLAGSELRLLPQSQSQTSALTQRLG